MCKLRYEDIHAALGGVADATVAQLVEQRTRNAQVSSSNLDAGSIFLK